MNKVNRKKLGQLLCEKGYLDQAALEIALSQQGENNSFRVGKILVDAGFVSRLQLNQVLAEQAGIEKADLDQISIDPGVIELIAAEIVSKYSILPLRYEDNALAVAMVDPFCQQALEDIRLISGCLLKKYYAEPAQIDRAILKYYGSNVARMLDNLVPDDSKTDAAGRANNYSAAKLQEMAREPSLVNLVNLIILEAIDARASDIHIEPFAKEVKIKYRVDGILLEKTPSSKRLQAAIVSRIKIMANMNIAERFVPQDGHIEFAGKAGKIDIRVSTVPTIFGESVTMRILDRSASLIDLDGLGMNEKTLQEFNRSLKKAHGIVLVTGPTGSGKTTTLYAALNKIYTPSLKIITIEDPVEYQLDGIIQMPVNPKRGLTFATGLRHILRQDPDIIMVGEIRDKETADIAIRAALTGHLVLSTLHTNDAAGAITRLIDMGVEPFLLASSLETVLAQRLVRKICAKCRVSYKPEPSLLKSLNGSIDHAEDITLYTGSGCEDCMKTGMSGRIGIFELLSITERIRELISKNPSAEKILKAADKHHTTMRADGIAKVIKGLTTPQEVLRVTQEE